ncbi:hypothetical protein FRC03_005693 [Tulasnella sp. 419]|nr:hypothetical protein FRC03_005693 [Tulasnella sp. 419]
MGRGGRLLLDRRLPSVRHPLDDPSNYTPPPLPLSPHSPQSSVTPYKIKHELLTQSFLSKPSVYGDAENGASGMDDTEAVDEEDEERAVARAAELQDRAWKTEERWRYDADVGVVVGGVVGLGDSEDGEEVRLIVDDYDSDRQWPLRKKLLLEEDFNHLMRIDDRHIHAAAGLYDARMEKQATMAAAAAARRRAVSVSSTSGSRSASVQPTQPPLPPLQAQTTGGTPQPTPVSTLSSSAAQVNGTAGSPINLPNGNPVAIAVPASAQQQQAAQQIASSAAAAAAKKMSTPLQLQMQLLASKQQQQQQPGNQMMMNGLRQQQLQGQGQLNGVTTGKPVSQGSPTANSTAALTIPDSSPSPTLKTLNGVPHRPPPLMNGNGSNGLFISQQQQLKNAGGMFNGVSQPVTQTQLSPTVPQIPQGPMLSAGASNMALKMPPQRQKQLIAGTPNQRGPVTASSPGNQQLELNGMSPQLRASQSPITPHALPSHLQQQQQAGGRASPVNGVARLGQSTTAGGRSSPGSMHHPALHGGHGHSPLIAHSSSPLAGVGVTHHHQQTVVGGPSQAHINGY